MALPIIENPILGQMTLETAEWVTSGFTWVNRTNQIIGSIDYRVGGRVGLPGQPSVDVGNLNVSFKNLTSQPLVGDLVRLRRNGTSEYVFTGYVQDISQRVFFDNFESLNNPVVVTSLVCVDWVGYISQLETLGAGGSSAATPGITRTDSYYVLADRITNLNRIFDSTNYTPLISLVGTFTDRFGDTDLVGTVSSHLDLVANTALVSWSANSVLPTNRSTGRTNFISVYASSGNGSSGKKFTDELGVAGNLHYTEIDIESSSANIANNFLIENRCRFHIEQPEVTRVGGFNQENFAVIAGKQVTGVMIDKSWETQNTVSIEAYGNRASQIQTNLPIRTLYKPPTQTPILITQPEPNFVTNPSMEYSDDGYSGLTSSKVRRRKPSEDSNPFDAYDGEWAMRSRVTSAVTGSRIIFGGGETDGLPVYTSVSQVFSAYAARSSGASRTDVRAQARIRYFDDTETEIFIDSGSFVNLTAANTWYRVVVNGVAPANAVRAQVELVFGRSGGGNHSVGDKLWGDAFRFSTASNMQFYVDGDQPWDDRDGYIWTGGVGASQSYLVNNVMDEYAARLLAKYSDTGLKISRIRWNVQEDITAVASLQVGKTVQVAYQGTTTTHKIVGIDGNVSTERYMIDYYLEKV